MLAASATDEPPNFCTIKLTVILQPQDMTAEAAKTPNSTGGKTKG
jgi:hypothetical protein